MGRGALRTGPAAPRGAPRRVRLYAVGSLNYGGAGDRRRLASRPAGFPAHVGPSARLGRPRIGHPPNVGHPLESAPGAAARPRARRVRLSNPRRLAAALTLAAVLAASQAGWAGAAAGVMGVLAERTAGLVSGQRGTPEPFAEIVVGPGDTLWTIAERHLGRSADLRQAVYRLQEWNRLATPAIWAGQRLRVPATWLEGR